MAQAAKTKKIFDGRYEILSIVGRGARSVVYHARHVMNPSSEVALKVLLDQKGRSSNSERLRREALAMVSCRHRYVVRLDDFHSVGALCYLSMEYAPESDLRHYAERNGGKLKHNQAERFMKQLAEALTCVHKAGILHRDVKPDNILVVSEKEIRLTDFGVAVLPGEECSIADLQSGIGTMNYMAPEILEGKAIDLRCDIYALGVVMYEMISGVNPFEKAPLAQQIEARKDHNIAPLVELAPGVPSYLAEIITQAMSYSPERRFASANDLLQTLLNSRAAASMGDKPKTKTKQTQPAAHLQEQRVSLVQSDTKQDRSGAFAGTQPTVDRPEARLESSPEPLQPKKKADATMTELPQKESPGNRLAELTRKKTVLINRETVDKMRGSSNDAPAQPRSRPHQFKSMLLAVSIMFFLGVFLPGVRREINSFSIRYFKIDIGKSLARLTGTEAAPLIPTYQGQPLAFPQLPSGMYAGKITNLLPGKAYPLTVVSLAEQDKMVVIVGMEGWSPATISPSAVEQQPDGLDAAKRLRVSSNGFILDFTGQNMDGELVGFFRNAVTDAQGEWNLKPIGE